MLLILVPILIELRYAPIAGFAPFISKSLEFAYGEKSEAIKSQRIAAVQSISGTGGCRLAGEFIRKFFGPRKIFMPNPTWGNHLAIYSASGLNPAYYPYYDHKQNKVDFDAVLKFVHESDKQSVFLLHACAHNPTGLDFSEDQWDILSKAMKEKQHMAFLDSAYQVNLAIDD